MSKQREVNIILAKVCRNSTDHKLRDELSWTARLCRRWLSPRRKAITSSDMGEIVIWGNNTTPSPPPPELRTKLPEGEREQGVEWQETTENCDCQVTDKTPFLLLLSNICSSPSVPNQTVFFNWNLLAKAVRKAVLSGVNYFRKSDSFDSRVFCSAERWKAKRGRWLVPLNQRIPTFFSLFVEIIFCVSLYKQWLFLSDY